jgi:hypothetical protein
MALIDQNFLDVILNKIRVRRGTISNDSTPLDILATRPAAKLREARFTDFEAVSKLKSRWGLFPDSLENWERLWRRNPALEFIRFQPPIGWVLEAEGRVVGYLGNIAQLYHYGDSTLAAVAASGFVVEPAYRGASLSLVAAFYRQSFPDLYLNTTAIKSVGMIAKAFKADPLPQSDYDTVLFWILQPYPAAQAVLHELDLPAPLLHVGAALGSMVVGADKFLKRRWPHARSTPFAIREISATEIANDFEDLWRAKLREPSRLLGNRSARALQWHFRIPGDRGSTRILCCYSNRELLGYSVVRNDPCKENSLRRSVIADIVARRDDSDILGALFVAAHDLAKSAGSHSLEILGFPHSVRQVCAAWNPYLRKYPACPFYYKAADPGLHKKLSDPGAWYASPFDGDTTLMP